MELAAALRSLADQGKTLTEICQLVKKSKSWVSKHLAASVENLGWNSRRGASADARAMKFAGCHAECDYSVKTGIHMGDGIRRKRALLLAGKPCIFCGGGRTATTEEHCPPRALFRNRQWPEGYSFSACDACNGGTSDDDLMVAFLAQLDPSKQDSATIQKGAGLMRMVNRRFPDALKKMFDMTVSEKRSRARRVGMHPGPGETYQDLGIANVTDEMHKCVGTLAAKLTKAVYYMNTGAIFPSDAGIMFKWFTNAEKMEHGSIPALDLLSTVVSMSSPKERGGKDLKDQFDYKYSVDKSGDLHLMQTVFGEVFGFITIFSQVPGHLESIEDGIKQKTGNSNSPFANLSTNRK